MTGVLSEHSVLKLCLSKPSSLFKICQWKYAWNFFTITQARSANKMPLGTQCAIEALVFCQQRAPYSLKTQPDWLVWTAFFYVSVRFLFVLPRYCWNCLKSLGQLGQFALWLIVISETGLKLKPWSLCLPPVFIWRILWICFQSFYSFVVRSYIMELVIFSFC